MEGFGVSGLEVESVAGFLPVVGPGDELEAAFPGADAHEHPVEGDEEGVFDEVVVFPAVGGEEGGVDEDEVSGEEAGERPEDDGEGEVLGDSFPAEGEPEEGERPVEGVDEE